MIIVQAPSKPFALTEKRSVKAKETLELYKDEIEEAYSKFADEDEIVMEGIMDAGSLVEAITAAVKTVVGQDVSSTENLFERGQYRHSFTRDSTLY